MEYTQKDVLEAIWEVVPSFKVAHQNNIFLGVPVLVKESLLTYFLTKDSQPQQSESYNKAGRLLIEAFRDLQQDGRFKYKDHV